MVSVGVLAALISVIVLVTVAIADRAFEHIVRNFAISRLHRTNRAPVVHDSDTWILNIPRSVVKYHRHPAILVTVLCALLLLVSEVVVELGVDVSLKCNPKEERGLIITPGDSSKTFTTFELSYSAGYIQSVNFLDGDLKFVTSGMPKKMNSTFCFHCLDGKKDDILRDCSAKIVRQYGLGELRVGVKTTDGSFGTVSIGFMGPSGEDFRGGDGSGDLTSNGEHAAIFSFTKPDPRNDKVLTLFEYGNQEHIKQLLDNARNAKGKPVWEETTGPVRVTEISCRVNKLSEEHFRLAVMAYRTVQLENPIVLAKFNGSEEQFSAVTEDDVYRAVLSMKIMEDTQDTGIYYEYTTCGKYNWHFLAPILVVVLLIIVLGLVSIRVSSGVNLPRVPNNSRSWYHHATRIPMERSGVDKPEHSGYFESIYEEMMLVPDNHSSGTPRVVFQSRLSRPRGGDQDRGEHGPESILAEELYEVQMSQLYYQSDFQMQTNS